MNLKALFRNVPATAYLYGLLAVGLVAGYQGWAYHQREVGKRDLLIAQAEQTNAALRQTADSLAKVYRVDTLRLTRLKTVWDTAYKNLTDTVRLTDTVKVPVKVLVLADSTLQACVDAKLTCEKRVATANAIAQNWEKMYHIAIQSRPSFVQRRTSIAVGIGAVVDRTRKIAVGPTISAGIRIFP